MVLDLDLDVKHLDQVAKRGAGFCADRFPGRGDYTSLIEKVLKHHIWLGGEASLRCRNGERCKLLVAFVGDTPVKLPSKSLMSTSV